MRRTNNCNELDLKHLDKEVVLSWWVHRRRDHWDIVFIDLRDVKWLTQIAFDPSFKKDIHTKAHKLRSEYVITIKWKVRKRPEWQNNNKMKTWEIEVLVSELIILNESVTPPFEIDYEKQVWEEIRLKYRYLDLRRERMRDNIIFRSKLTKFIRDFYDREWFFDIETPIMIKWTPEWSREYLVPSRVYPWNFFVLPQSPQQLKQLLMVAWFDRYFQIAKCFRDEDLRWDRQPEFTQIDVEMSFIEQDDIIKIHEKLFLEIVGRFSSDKKLLFKPFNKITWQDAMEKYWSDKPDLRFDLEIKDITKHVKNCGFKVFKTPANKDWWVVKALCVKGWNSLTRKDIDDLTKYAQSHWAKWLAYIQVRKWELTGPVVKFLSKSELDNIIKETWADKWDIIFFWADDFIKACENLWVVRSKVAEMMWLIDDGIYAFTWVVDFPAFEKNEQWNIVSVHHPFTRPYSEDLKKYKKWDLTKIKSHCYDLVLNGVELWWWSIRIHEKDLQKEMFELMKIWEKEQENKFGHLLKAFEYWAPPHWWIAFWLDRIIMLLRWEKNIREIIPFPKDQKSKDLMLWAPGVMPNEQLEELWLSIIENISI